MVLLINIVYTSVLVCKLRYTCAYNAHAHITALSDDVFLAGVLLVPSCLGTLAVGDIHPLEAVAYDVL